MCAGGAGRVAGCVSPSCQLLPTGEEREESERKRTLTPRPISTDHRPRRTLVNTSPVNKEATRQALRARELCAGRGGGERVGSACEAFRGEGCGKIPYVRGVR